MASGHVCGMILYRPYVGGADEEEPLMQLKPSGFSLFWWWSLFDEAIGLHCLYLQVCRSLYQPLLPPPPQVYSPEGGGGVPFPDVV